jgi:hypothetical protein
MSALVGAADCLGEGCLGEPVEFGESGKPGDVAWGGLGGGCGVDGGAEQVAGVLGSAGVGAFRFVAGCRKTRR